MPARSGAPDPLLARALDDIGAVPLLSAAELDAAARQLGAARQALLEATCRIPALRQLLLRRTVEPLVHCPDRPVRALATESTCRMALLLQAWRIHALAGCALPPASPRPSRAALRLLSRLPVRGEALSALAERAPGRLHQRLAPALARWQQARNRIAEANLRLVVRAAAEVRHPAIPLLDLIQDGSLGLLRAADRFDPARGFRFSTYAIHWIRCAMREAVRRATATPAALPLDGPLGPHDDRRVADVLIDHATPAPDEAAAERLAAERLAQALAALPDPERAVLELRYGLGPHHPLSVQRAARQLGLGPHAVRRLERQALDRLRQNLRDQHTPARRPHRRLAPAPAGAHHAPEDQP